MIYFNDKKKLELQLLALKQFKSISSTPPINFITKKEFFWFINTEDQKFAHKASLEYYYSQFCDFFPQRAEIIFNFYRRMHLISPIYPKLEENEHFFIMDFFKASVPLTELTKNDCLYIKENFPPNDFTPFCYNSMAFNLLRLPNQELKLIDIKHINKIQENYLFCYFSNEEFKINTFYEIAPLSKGEREKIFKYLSRDYDIYNCEYRTIIELP